MTLSLLTSLKRINIMVVSDGLDLIAFHVIRLFIFQYIFMPVVVLFKCCCILKFLIMFLFFSALEQLSGSRYLGIYRCCHFSVHYVNAVCSN